MRYYIGIDGVDLSVCGHSRTHVRKMLMLYNQYASKLTAYNSYKDFISENQKFIQSIKNITLKQIVPNEYHHLIEEEYNGKKKIKINAHAILGSLFSINPNNHKDWWKKINHIMSIKVHNVKDTIVASRISWGGKLTSQNNPHGGIVFHVGRLAPYNHNFLKDAAGRMVFLQNLVKVFGTHHTKIAKLDLAIDIPISFEKLKITPLVSQEQIQIFQDSIYINGNEEDPTGIVIYNKALKEASYLGSTRLEIKLETILKELFRELDYEYHSKALQGLSDKFNTLDYLHLLVDGSVVDYSKVKILAEYILKKMNSSVKIESDQDQLNLSSKHIEKAIVNFIHSLNDFGEYALIDYERFDQLQLQRINASEILENFLDTCWKKYKISPKHFKDKSLLKGKPPSARELEKELNIDRRVISLQIIPFLKKYGDRIDQNIKRAKKCPDTKKPYAPEDFIKVLEKYEEFEKIENNNSYTESEKDQYTLNNLQTYFPDFYPEISSIAQIPPRSSKLDTIKQTAIQQIKNKSWQSEWDNELVESKNLAILDLKNPEEFLTEEDKKELQTIPRGGIEYYEMLALLTKEKRRIDKLANLVT